MLGGSEGFSGRSLLSSRPSWCYFGLGVGDGVYRLRYEARYVNRHDQLAVSEAGQPHDMQPVYRKAPL